MSVILIDKHHKVIKRLKRKFLIINALWFIVVLALFFSPYILNLQKILLTEAYSIMKSEFDSILQRQELLSILRSKSFTVGQALDVVDVVMTQKQVPVSIVLAVISQESEFKPGAISAKGARGLMQVMPSTFTNYSANPLLAQQHQIQDPVLNMRAGISFLGDMYRIYGDWKKALRAYQAGPDNANNKVYDWYANGVLGKAERYERR